MKTINTGHFLSTLLLTFLTTGSAWAASETLPWPKKIQAAVSISYDDAAPVHYQKVTPLLEKHGLRATFYLTVSFVDNADAWKKVADQNHELGNHALFPSVPPRAKGKLRLAGRSLRPRRLLAGKISR